MPNFTTAFTQPAVLTGLVATPDAATSAITLTWDVSALSAALFYAYLVRRRTSTTDWVTVGTLTTQAAPTFVDQESPIGSDVSYEVTQSNGALESDPAALTTRNDVDAWFFVTPDSDLYSFRMRVTGSASWQRAVQQQATIARGRPYPLVVKRGAKGHSGSIDVWLAPVDRDLVALLEDLQVSTGATVPYTVLKNPFGQTRRVSIDGISGSRGVAGHQTVTVAWTEIA